MMWSQLFQLSFDQKGTLQRQLREKLVSAILDGKIPLNHPLPSSRELATQLGVSRNTTVLAYQQLVDEGYLIPRERSGHYVNEAALSGRVSVQPGEQISHADQPDLKRYIKLRPSAQRNISKPRDWKKYPYPFIYGQLDPDLFPIADWRDCCRQALSVMEIQKATPDRFDEDNPSLIEQIRARLLPRRGVWASPDEILVTLGAQQALYLLSDLMTDESTVVGIEDPGYVDARNIFSLKSSHVIPLPIDGDGLVPDNNLNRCDYVYVTPSHHSPTTVTLPMERRRDLLERAVKSEFLIVEDDYESEVNFVNNPSPALKSLDQNNRVIYIGSLSKTLAPGLRIGYMVGPAELIREARALRRLMVRHPPANNQRIVALFLSMGHHDSLIQRLSHTYQERWQVMGDALTRYLPNSSRIPTFGGTSFWVEGPQGMDSRDLQDKARQNGILIEPGDIYFMADNGPRNFFRLGFSAIALDKIEPGIRKLAGLM
jgi:GntR family transcriptional regulator/MocR family aminotransferase